MSGIARVFTIQPGEAARQQLSDAILDDYRDIVMGMLGSDEYHAALAALEGAGPPEGVAPGSWRLRPILSAEWGEDTVTLRLAPAWEQVWETDE